MRTRLIILLLAALALTEGAYAQKTVHYTGSGGILIKVAHLAMTEVQFEGAEVASILLGFPAEAISIQNTQRLLYIQPLAENLSGDMFVVFKNGKSAMLTLTPAPADERDRSIRVICDVEQTADRVGKVKREGLTPSGLIKAMILGEDADGVSISDSEAVLSDHPVKVIAHKKYDAVFMKGYIADVPAADFDIRNLSAPGLVAGAVRDGKLYLVFFQ